MTDSPLATTDPARSIYGDADRSFLNPSSLFVDSNYTLRLNAWCSAAGVTLAMRYRFLRANDSELVDAAEQLIVTSNRVLTTKDFALPVGWLIDLSVFALAGTPAYGTLFMQVQLIRGAGAAATPVATLLQAYVTANQAKAWPGSALENSLDGPGAIVSITGAATGAGVEISETMPVGTRRQFLTLKTKLVTSAVVANRNTVLFFDDGVNEYVRYADSTNVVASSTVFLAYSDGSVAQVNGANNMHGIGVADILFLAAGHRIRTTTVGLDVGDQYTTTQYLMREWLTAD